MPGIKELKNRIKSISSTRKITRAMQMVSAAKMRKAQNAALSSRTYSDLAWELIHNLAAKTHLENPLLQIFPEATKTGIIVISTNKGYVGSFNTNLANKVAETEAAVENVKAELYVMGKKIKDFAVRFNKNLAADLKTTFENWRTEYGKKIELADLNMSFLQTLKVYFSQMIYWLTRLIGKYHFD
jgi:F-type H+-transporting ATPase subunit gamma